MIHKMRLQNDPFNKIKNKTKTIEMRLNDEKRKELKINDVIEFTDILTNEKIYVKVTNLYYYKDFKELYKNHDNISIGYLENEDANPNDMEKYYSKDEINKYGVVGIEIKVIPIDIDIKNEVGTFKLRTSGIIIRNNKVLVAKSKKFNGYVFPGGHVTLGESSINAIKREIKEELNYNFEIENLFCVHEYVYLLKDKKYANEICYYYKIKADDNVPDKDFIIEEIDNGIKKTHEYNWIKIEDLLKENVKPLDISKLIIENKNLNNLILTTNIEDNN